MTIKVTIEKDRPKTMRNNTTYPVTKDRGYVIVNNSGELAIQRIFLVYERAKEVAPTSTRVVQRNWFEKRSGCELVVLKEEEIN